MILIAALAMFAGGGSVLANQNCKAQGLMADTALAAQCKGRPTVSLAFVGDMLMHSPLQRQAASQGFGAIWAEATPWLAAADIAVANLETPVAPGMARNFRPTRDPGPVFDNWVYSSFPLFNTPPAILDAARASGIDVLTTANNHALDRGPEGVRRSLAEIAKRGLFVTGTRATRDQTQFATTMPSPIGAVVMIACSFSSNGIPDPEHQLFYCYRDRDALIAEVRRARAAPGVALVLVLPHWGVEYSHTPLARQRRLAADLVAAGADAVIGTHAHVVQPMEIVPTGRGLGVVAFGTGNFVSNQSGLSRQTGMLVWLEFCAGRREPFSLTNPRALLSRAGWRSLVMDRYPHALRLGSPDGANLRDDAHFLVDRHAPGLALGGQVTCAPSDDLLSQLVLQ